MTLGDRAYDAVVIGAGPAGSSVALMLARAGWSVAVIEKARFPRRKLCGEFMSAAAGQALAELGLGDIWRDAPGPFVTRLVAWTASVKAGAAMPRLKSASPWGRVVGRDRLDQALLEEARRAGAHVFQPMRAVGIAEQGPMLRCEAQGDDSRVRLDAPLIVAAHGSWEAGSLSSAPARPHAPSDLFAFKARLSGVDLDPDIMALIAFPGGYGGLVNIGDGVASLSCCIRRDVLADARAMTAGRAGEAVLAHIRRHCRGAYDATRLGDIQEGWLAAGPIRPGIRARQRGRLVAVGNAAGEAHPIIAEGVAMALQSGRLLGRRLVSAGRDKSMEGARAYARSWLWLCAPRIAAATLFAAAATRPGPARAAGGLFAAAPGLLTFGARLSGKSGAL